MDYEYVQKTYSHRLKNTSQGGLSWLKSGHVTRNHYYLVKWPVIMSTSQGGLSWLKSGHVTRNHYYLVKWPVLMSTSHLTNPSVLVSWLALTVMRDQPSWLVFSSHPD